MDFRIHYHGSASRYPLGLPNFKPPVPKKRVDVAITCVALFGNVNEDDTLPDERYPEYVIHNLNPRHVIMSHWENFFRLQEEKLRTVSITDVQKFVDNVDSLVTPDSRTLPAPGVTVTLKKCP